MTKEEGESAFIKKKPRLESCDNGCKQRGGGEIRSRPEAREHMCILKGEDLEP